MAATIKLSQNEWVKFFLCKWWEPILASVSEIERKNYYGWIQDGGIQVGRIQDGCHHQVESEWISEFLFVQNGWIQYGRIQYGCHQHIESESMSEISFVQNGWIQDGCLHQDESEWMTLSQIELVGVRGISKMAESKMVEFKMAEFKMAAIIKLSENEWVWVRLN